MTCDISEPLFIQPTETSNPLLTDYYKKIEELIRRFKAEHEDETACRVEIREYISLTKMAETKPYNIICSLGIYKSCLNAMESCVSNMIENMAN